LPPIEVPLQDPAWGEALNERVTIMAGKEITRAEIRMNPAELGPIRVQLSVDERGTSVSFTAQHAHTREAIEQALPRLRELFGEQGLSLGQTSVSDRGVQQDRHDADGLPREASVLAGDDPEPDSGPAPSARVATGLVDTFA
jgi:flagellar hook-length control protein FliK